MRESRMELFTLRLLELWHNYPTMRFGQLLFNLYQHYNIHEGGKGRNGCPNCGALVPNCFDYYYVEDEPFFAWLLSFEGWCEK